MAALLTEKEKSQIRYHLGYLASGFAASMQFGTPRPYQTVFLLESAMSLLVEPNAIERVQRILCHLERIECSMMGSIDNLGVSEVDTIKLRADHPSLLEREYRRWTDRIADIFGVPKYAFSTRNTGGTGPGSILRVTG